MSTLIQKSGNSFIDDNHDSLLDYIDQITNLVRFDFDPAEFKKNTSDFIKDIENHFMHEEVILRGAGYEDFDRHSVEHRRLSMQLHMDNLELLTLEEATDFIVRLRTDVFTHELFCDQKYWSIFQEPEDHELLIHWSSKYDTAHAETNEHHKALANYVNRLHKRMQENPDRNIAVRELRNLYEYSEFHYSEEEQLLGDKLWPGHKTNHENLLIDLHALINEIEQDKYNIENIGEYLKFWLLNHIKVFDIPAFKGEK